MSKIELKKDENKKKPSFKSSIYGFYNFGLFNGKEYFEIRTVSEAENEDESKHSRQVIDIDKETAIELIKLLKDNFKI